MQESCRGLKRHGHFRINAIHLGSIWSYFQGLGLQEMRQHYGTREKRRMYLGRVSTMVAATLQIWFLQKSGKVRSSAADNFPLRFASMISIRVWQEQISVLTE